MPARMGLAGRKRRGAIPAAIRPHLLPLYRNLVAQGLPGNKVADGMADTFNCTRSNIWKLLKPRSVR